MMDLWAKACVMGRRYLVVLRKYWWIPAATVGLGLSVSVWRGMHLADSYVSSAQMVITGQFQIEGTARVTETGDYLGTQFALMTSEQVAQRARAKIQAQHPDWIPVQVSLDVNQIPRTTFLLLRATGGEKLYTQAFLDGVMQEYMALKKEMRAEKSDDMNSAIRNSQILLEKEFDADQRELINFQEKNKLGFAPSQFNSAGEFLSTLERELASLQTELNLLNVLNLDQIIDRSQQITPRTTTGNGGQQGDRSMVSLDPTFASSYGPMTDYQRAKGNVLELKAKREELLKTWTPAHPGIRAIDEDIVRAEKQMDNYQQQSIDVLKMRKESIQYRIKNLESLSQQWATKATDLSQKLAESDRIKLKLERDRNQYDRLITTQHGVKQWNDMEQEPLSILESASIAVLSKPNVSKIIFEGFATGLVAGLALLFLIDKTNDKIGSIVECTGNFREHAVLGQIPHDEMEGGLALLVPYDPRQALLEAFRSLRSSILFAPVEGTRPKALMVTSAEASEGKTAIAANLAATLAFSGAKTLLVDCNLVNGRLHEIFDTTPDRGLANVLQQQVKWTEAVVQTNIDNLYLLPRGEALAYPAEHYFGAFLKDVYEEFDYIIFDSGSVLDNVDALSFAPIVDGVLFVIRFAQTSAGQATRALASLNARQVNVLGLICNDVG